MLKNIEVKQGGLIMLNFDKDMREFQRKFPKKMKSINFIRQTMENSYLDGKVLLILSKNDETFSEKVKQELSNLMPNPKVCDSLEGGHLALFLKIDSYIALAKKFINEEPSA